MTEISSGIVAVSSGVTSTGLLVLKEGILQVFDEGWAENVGLVDGGKAVVFNDGVLYDCTVSSGGTATVSEAGFAQAVTVENGGLYLVSSGGTAHHSIIQFGGTQIVYADTMAASANVMAGGVLRVETEGYVQVPVVSQGGSACVSEDGFVDRATVFGTVELDGGVANNAGVLDGGRLVVLEDGVTNNAKVSSGGRLEVFPGGFVNYTSVFDGGSAVVSAGGVSYNAAVSGGTLVLAAETEEEQGALASNTTVHSGGSLVVSNGAKAASVRENGGYVAVWSEAEVTFVSNTISDLTLSDAAATVHSGTTANNAKVSSGGILEVFSGGTATEVLENGGYVEISDGATVTFASNTISGLELAGSATVHAGTTVTNTTVNAGGKLEIFSGGTVNGVTINPGGTAEVSSGAISGAVVNADGSLLIYDGTRITGHMTFESGATVIPFVGSILDFDLTQTRAGYAALVNDLSVLMGTPSYTLTVADAQAEGTYALADGAAKFKSTLTVQNTLGEMFGTLTVGETLSVAGTDYTLNLNGGALTLTVAEHEIVPFNPVGTKDRVSWDPPGADGYALEYSTDSFAHTLGVTASSNAMDLLGLPAGTYQWRVRLMDGDRWTVGNEIFSDNTSDTPEALRSNADGKDDLFFASPVGTWDNFYYAKHVGSGKDWAGTNEVVSANGKGRIQNLFFGSSDPNVLCLTDEANGDAIFADDIYTDLPEETEALTARLYKIQEIRAGAGADIVDMTCQRVEYTGGGMTIRGGDGSDVIWANNGDNALFGDEGNDRIVGASGNDVIAGGIGNDRMHGGGGDDVFTFCDNWGNDTVEQLADGSVTLWFASGNESNWDAETLTCTDGENSVKVTGVTADRITLKFGTGTTDEDAARFAMLSGTGAFSAFTSQRIFEESGKEILASL